MTTPVKMRLSSPADMLAAMPYLLGFHPVDSITVSAFAGTRVEFAARADLPQPGAPAYQIEDAATRLVTAVRQQDGITQVVLAGYGPANRVTPVVDVLRRIFTNCGIPVREALRVTDGRYYSYVCDKPDCCPPEGKPFDVTTTEVAAQATFEGMVALPDRAALVAQIAPLGGKAQTSMYDAIRRVTASLITTKRTGLLAKRGFTAVRRAEHRYAHDQVLTDDEIAFLTVALGDRRVRDFAWRRTGDDDSRIALWTDVTRRCHRHLAAGPASLLAFTAWKQGMGALAQVAIDRALEADPNYSIARVIDGALARAVPPSMLDGLFPSRPRRDR